MQEILYPEHKLKVFLSESKGAIHALRSLDIQNVCAHATNPCLNWLLKRPEFVSLSMFPVSPLCWCMEPTLPGWCYCAGAKEVGYM